jgi:hypothetical protein
MAAPKAGAASTPAFGGAVRNSWRMPLLGSSRTYLFQQQLCARPHRGGGGGCARALAVCGPPPPKTKAPSCALLYIFNKKFALLNLLLRRSSQVAASTLPTPDTAAAWGRGWSKSPLKSEDHCAISASAPPLLACS